MGDDFVASQKPIVASIYPLSAGIGLSLISVRYALTKSPVFILKYVLLKLGSNLIVSATTGSYFVIQLYMGMISSSTS